MAQGYATPVRPSGASNSGSRLCVGSSLALACTRYYQISAVIPAPTLYHRTSNTLVFYMTVSGCISINKKRFLLCFFHFHLAPLYSPPNIYIFERKIQLVWRPTS